MGPLHGVDGHFGLVPPPPRPDHKCRRVVSTGSADVFVGGVLCTRSARVMWNKPFMVRVRAGAEGANFPSACFYAKQKNEESNIC